MLTLAQVSVAALAQFIDSHDAPGAFFDPRTGEIWPSFDGEVRDESGELVDLDEVDWLRVGGEGSRAAYDDMVAFAGAVAEPGLHGRLMLALRGKGAFGRFRDVMWNAPEELGRAWSRYRNGCAERRALRWLSDKGLVAQAEVQAADAALEEWLEAALALAGRRRGVGTVVDLAERLSHVTDHWSPATIARLNDYEVKVVKVRGDFVWHAHKDTDELFLVLDGRLTIQLRDGEVVLGPGQLYVVPAGVEHRPTADAEVSALLIEPAGVVNTGGAGGALTASPDESLLD